MKAAAGLRGRGLAADTDFLGRSLKAQMREADRLGARYVAVIGGREVETRSAKLKEMRSGSERPVDLGDLGRLAAELAAEVVKELAAGFAAGPSPKRGSR
jgi:histidyl-tRNA synthetase